MWWLVLGDGEKPYLDTRATYSRYYGGDGSYAHIDGFFLGSPGFVAPSLGATALANKSRRDAARRDAMPRWRDRQLSQVILTSHRIMCTAGRQWLSFYYRGVRSYYPEPLAWSIAFDFPDCPPLMLTGQAAPALCAFAVWTFHGERGLREHPAMEPLWTMSSAPSAPARDPSRTQV